jgi:uncharacterized integral membrane protein
MKILLYVFITVVALGAAVLFSVQNAAPVTIWFYNWQFTASLAIVVFLSIIAGAVIASFSFLSVQFARSMRRRAMAKASKGEEKTLSTPEADRSASAEDPKPL